MSWILGFTGTSLSPALRERLASVHDDALHRAQGPTHYIALGGLPETCHFGSLPEMQDGVWGVV